MLNITCASADLKLAEQMQQDLTRITFKMDFDYLLVLISAASQADETVQQAIETAQKKNQRLVPILLDNTPVPDTMLKNALLDFRAGYKRGALIQHLRRLELGEDRLRGNRRIFAAMALIVGLMFAVAIYMVGGGLVAFPQDEYATEQAIEDAMIATLVYPTLEGLIPRSTNDAVNFPATVEAVSTRDRAFLRGTATALPMNVAATLNAIGTSAALTVTPTPN
jgi:hypothetical protein